LLHRILQRFPTSLDYSFYGLMRGVPDGLVLGALQLP
jgi:hypothetical protein